MPLYVYEPTVYTADSPVSECCHFEALQSLSEPKLWVCPTCGHPVHRAVTTCGAIHVREKRTTAPPASPRGRISDGLKEKLQDMLGRDFSTPSNHAGQDDQEGDHDRAFPASSASETRAGKAARLIARHICTTLCRY